MNITKKSNNNPPQFYKTFTFYKRISFKIEQYKEVKAII